MPRWWGGSRANVKCRFVGHDFRTIRTSAPLASQPYAALPVATVLYSAVKLAADSVLQVEGVEGFERRGLGQAHAAKLSCVAGKDAMAYKPIRSADDLSTRLIVGVTREDHWLDFKGFDQKTGHAWSDSDECRRDVAQFANASGGTIVIGALEEGHLLGSFRPVPSPESVVRWVDEVLKIKALREVVWVNPGTFGYDGTVRLPAACR
jgi:hypothetical protein